MIDLHFVAPGLAVGACFPAEAALRLAREHGIQRVLDVRGEACDDAEALGACGIRLLHLPTRDTCAVPQERLREGVAFACEGLARGERVLVHCQYGIGRSALVALCVLVARGVPPLEALAQAKDARPVISPSPEQLEAFVAFAAHVRGEAGAAWPVPTLEALGAIAWRHLHDGRGAGPTAEAARQASTQA
ncbi:protein-tyrosine phosphatase family protein [Anaeromyxobacter sp. Red801]